MDLFSMLIAMDRRSFAVPAHQVDAERRALLEETYVLAEHDVVVRSKERHLPPLRTRALTCTHKEDPKDDGREFVKKHIERIGDALDVSKDAEGDDRLVGGGLCEADGNVLLFAARPTPPGAVRIGWGRHAKDPAEQARYHDASQAYVKALARVTSITGRRFKLCLGTAGCALPEDDQEDGYVRIYPNAFPPGESNPRNLREVFGLPIALNAPEIVANGPTIGRGVVVSDEAKTPVAQVLGRHVFVLFPILTNFNALTSVRIFDRTIAAALEAIDKASADEAQLPEPSPEEVAEAAWRWIDVWPEELAKSCERYRENIRTFQEGAALNIRFLRETEALAARLHDTDFLKKARERVPSDIVAIRAMEGVASVAAVDDGLQVVTRDLAIAWEGRRYAIGSLHVRMNAKAKVTIWSEAPRHSAGIPHPHIDDFTRPCFGNAGDRIASLLAEHRYADAFEVVMSWIVRGYTHELARHKIEEWPEIAEDGAVVPIETLVIDDDVPSALVGQEGLHA